MKIDRIVGYGCSLVFGEELADKLHFATEEESIVAKRDKSYAQKYYASYPPNDLENNNKSFISKLATRFGIEHENRAKSGSSLDYSLHCLQLDLMNGEIRDTDLVIIGMTFLQRYFYISSEGPVTRTFNPRKGVHTKDDRMYVRFFAEKDSHRVWNFFSTLQTLDLIASINKNMFIQPCAQSLDELIEQVNVLPILLKYKNFAEHVISNLQSVLFPNICLTSFNTPILPYGHPNEEAHNKFAEVLSTKIGTYVL